QVRHQADKSGLGKFMRVMAHGVVDAPDLHDRDDRARRRPVGNGDIGTHFSVAQLHLCIERLHQPALAFAFANAGNLRSARALPEKIRSRSLAPMSSAPTASIVPRISERPPSASKGASVANRENCVPKKSWPQRVAARAPLSAVSA